MVAGLLGRGWDFANNTLGRILGFAFNDMPPPCICGVGGASDDYLLCWERDALNPNF